MFMTMRIVKLLVRTMTISDDADKDVADGAREDGLRMLVTDCECVHFIRSAVNPSLHEPAGGY